MHVQMACMLDFAYASQFALFRWHVYRAFVSKFRVRPAILLYLIYYILLTHRIASNTF